MKIVVAMSGHSQRFVDKGYVFKAFVEVLGKTMIEHVMDMFPVPRGDVHFIVRDEDGIGERIAGMFPGVSVHPIRPNTDGPVVSILSAGAILADDDPVVVTYCDLKSETWDYSAFEGYCVSNDLDGCMLTHVGFHPHRLYNKSFAFVRNDGPRMLEVMEKKPFTDDIFQEHASSGVYYYRSFGMMRRYFEELVNLGVRVNNEFYVTMAYNPMIRDGLRVWLYQTEDFMCFGTPEDVEMLDAWKCVIDNAGVTTKEELWEVFSYWRKYLR
jgi:NDP-sugar pyrophosphorylase family protein